LRFVLNALEKDARIVRRVNFRALGVVVRVRNLVRLHPRRMTDLGFLKEMTDEEEAAEEEYLNLINARSLRRKGVKGVHVGPYERKDHKKLTKKGSWSKYSR
jgi:hypothetical protein